MKTQATHFLFIVLLTQLLYGCFLTDLIKDKPVNERVNDVQIILTAAQASIAMDLSNGIITATEARSRFEKVKGINSKLTAIQTLVSDGQLELASLKLKVVETGMLNLQQYIRKKAMESQ